MQNSTLSIQDVDVNIIEEIRQQVVAENEKERQLYSANEEDSSGFSSQDILMALNSNEDGDAYLYIGLHRDNFVFDHDLDQWFNWPDIIGRKIVLTMPWQG